MKILAIGAHPDDLEIFCFGTLTAWRAMGADLALAIATDGAAGGDLPPDDLARIRRAEAIEGAKALRTTPVFLDFPDGALFADAALISTLGKLIADERPDLVVTHAPNCYHADHRALSMAVSQAVSFKAPLLVMDTLVGTGFQPTIWVDVTPHWPAKEQAILCHQSQNPARFVEAANKQAAFRASECNQPTTARAEAFRFDPRFPFADIRNLLPPAPSTTSPAQKGLLRPRPKL